MSTTVIKPWVESVTLHPDVVSPDFSEDIFALDLGPLADGNKNVPAGKRVKPEVGTGVVRVVGTCSARLPG
jgi:hypothetical protein